MGKLILVAPFSAIALAACGGPEPAPGNLSADNQAVKMTVANEVTAANGIAHDEPDREPEARVAPAPAPAPAAAAKPAPEPTKPRPEPEPPEPEPDADPDCAPEHRAAGHC